MTTEEEAQFVARIKKEATPIFDKTIAEALAFWKVKGILEKVPVKYLSDAYRMGIGAAVILLVENDSDDAT